MAENQHKPPKFGEKSFTCLHCGVLTTQKWSNDERLLKNLFGYQRHLFLNYRGNIDYDSQRCIESFLDNIETKFLSAFNRPYFLIECFNCKKLSLWVDGKMVYPSVLTSPPPHEDMPENVKKIYEEARQVQSASVRASAALLRVSLEQLTAHLGETKGSLHKRIANLEKKGLPSQVIKSLHIVRIYANEGGAHAGVIDLDSKDNEYILHRLFMLVNIIVHHTIASDKMIDDLYEGIPDNKKAGIENRHSNK